MRVDAPKRTAALREHGKENQTVPHPIRGRDRISNKERRMPGRSAADLFLRFSAPTACTSCRLLRTPFKSMVGSSGRADRTGRRPPARIHGEHGRQMDLQPTATRRHGTRGNFGRKAMVDRLLPRIRLPDRAKKPNTPGTGRTADHKRPKRIK